MCSNWKPLYYREHKRKHLARSLSRPPVHPSASIKPDAAPPAPPSPSPPSTKISDLLRVTFRGRRRCIDSIYVMPALCMSERCPSRSQAELQDTFAVCRYFWKGLRCGGVESVRPSLELRSIAALPDPESGHPIGGIRDGRTCAGV